MQIIKSIREFRALKITSPLGFVPTMGALHAAHLTLIKQSISNNTVTVVSIFVNPTQFNDPSDLKNYPTPTEKDITQCEQSGVDYLFMPDINTMYFDNEVLLETPNGLGNILEGACRSGHFNGVLRVVLKLLNIIKPTHLYLGQKDAQQLAIINKMVTDFFIDVTVVPCPLIRHNDGLAMSSRNTLLSANERIMALSLSKALFNAEQLIQHGEDNCLSLKQSMLTILAKTTDVEYVEILARDFSPIDQIKQGYSIILVAAKVGKIRLIDNILV